ncbi:MAG: sulfatase [Planctomycetota bacterium]
MLLPLGASCGREAPPEGPKHLVFVVIDTLRADALIDPANIVDTPNLDRFAHGGSAYSRAFSHAPMTLPSHAALFSSREPYATGVLNNGQSVSDDLPLFAQHLDQLGFETIGVYSLGTLHPAHGSGSSLDRGFDDYNGTSPYVGTAEEVVRQTAQRLEELDRRAAAVPQQANVNAAGALAPRRFLFCHFADPHEPYNDRANSPNTARLSLNGVALGAPRSTTVMSAVAEQLELLPGENVLAIEADHPILLRAMQLTSGRREIQFDRSLLRKPLQSAEIRFTAGPRAKRAKLQLWLTDDAPWDDIPDRYISEVEYVDAWFGRLTAMLKRRGILDDCILVFTSDHGEAFGEHGYWAHVQSVHEEMIHVPLFLWTAEKHRWLLDELPPSHAPVSHIDLVPTLLDLMDLPALPGAVGSSLVGGRSTPFLHLAETHTPESRANMLCLRDENRKLIYFADEDRFELFHLDSDPLEKHDLFAAHGGELVEWQKQLRQRSGEALAARSETGDLSEAELEVLRALGYLGDD